MANRSNTHRQAGLFPVMPRTRYQGSKRKLADWIAGHLEHVEFDTVLDAFGGTGSVAYELKQRGKAVTYNDILKFNYLIGLALIENQSRRLIPHEIDLVVTPDQRQAYDDLVQRTFSGIYFTDAENRWIDMAVGNIERLADPSARALAYYALFQSALAKRPYNLFHRRNLYMREADVSRSFGNKAAWDRPFEVHFRRFAAEANRAVFDNERPCRALNRDVLSLKGRYELVYIDPPYINAKGIGVNYSEFYHFLEGLSDYTGWPRRIDFSSKHRRMTPPSEPGAQAMGADPWSSAAAVPAAFEAVFERFADSVLVVSYRSDGIPSIEKLERMLARFKSRVSVLYRDRYQYALSINKRSREVLLVAV